MLFRFAGHWLIAAICLAMPACSPKKAPVNESNRIGIEVEELYRANRPFPGLDAARLLANSTYVTTNPDRPNLRYLSVDGDALTAIVRDFNETTQTTVRVPMQAGYYVLLTPALLRKECKFPVILSLSVLGEKRPLVEQILQPGVNTLISESFKLPSDRELELIIKMAPGSTDNYAATVRFFKFRIIKIEGIVANPGDA